MHWVNAADSHMIKGGKFLTRGGAFQRTWMDFVRWTVESNEERPNVLVVVA